jgi:hypothetical protein
MEHPSRRTALVAVVVSLVTSLVVGGGTLAFANHQWSDVPTGNAFHEDVGAFTEAGCGAGYPDGTFRPTQPVLRQQAARFLRACGTRIAQEDDDDLTTVPDGTGGVTLNSEGITAGAQGEGGGYVVALATIELSTSSDTPGDFPCTLVTGLRSPTAGHTGAGNFETNGALFDAPSDALTQLQTVTMTEMWEVTAGETITARTTTAKFGCDADVSAEGDLTLLYVPFAGDA